MPVYILAAACAVSLVVIAAVLFRRLQRVTDDGEPDGATGTHTGAMLSALFLLAFAIAIVVPWTTADSARMNTYTESQAIAEAYWTANELPQPAAGQVQAGLREYADLVVGAEWRMMANGRLSPAAWARLEAVRREAIAVPVKDEAIKEVRSGVLERIGEISGARRQRAMDAATTPPAGLLATTVLTGIAVILFPFLTGARPRGWTIAPLAFMAALLGVGIYLAFDISHSFDGALAVQPDAFTNVLQELRRIPGGG